MSQHPHIRHIEHDVNFGERPSVVGEVPKIAGALVVGVLYMGAAFVKIGYTVARDAVRNLRNPQDGVLGTYQGYGSGEGQPK